jgi:hypothetical protein
MRIPCDIVTGVIASFAESPCVAVLSRLNKRCRNSLKSWMEKLMKQGESISLFTPPLRVLSIELITLHRVNLHVINEQHHASFAAMCRQVDPNGDYHSLNRIRDCLGVTGPVWVLNATQHINKNAHVILRFDRKLNILEATVHRVFAAV